jgi:undecaprenyl diphosphate synthase
LEAEGLETFATPEHVGIIMDGNGRWATRRGRPRAYGHRAGAVTVRRIAEYAARMGIRQLTLFAFSTENWSRPPAEVAALMGLLGAYLRRQRRRLMRNDIRLRAIGRLGELPPAVRRELDVSIRATEINPGMTLCLALNYGGRAELTDAARRLVGLALAGQLHEEVDESLLSRHLYQPDMPPLDLIIRTGGEMRLSNFLLWQAAYAELLPTPVLWPDFTPEHFRAALADFARRERRFGRLHQRVDHVAPPPSAERSGKPYSTTEGGCATQIRRATITGEGVRA